MPSQPKRGLDAIISPTYAVPVTPSDETVLNPTRSLWIGGDGDLVVEYVDRPGVAITHVGVPAGEFLGQFIKVLAATTCTNIVARYN